MTSRDDEAWQAIVDNYGERPALDPEAGPHAEPSEPSTEPSTGPSGPPAGGSAAPAADPYAGPSPASAPGPSGGGPGSWDDPYPDADWTQDRFVPPPPPPVPTPPRDRFLAWAGMLGSPVVLLVCLVLGIDLPVLLAYALVAGFVGGFLYLVWQMPRGPRDPDDDGAVL